jgi:hypothetical protein
LLNRFIRNSSPKKRLSSTKKTKATTVAIRPEYLFCNGTGPGSANNLRIPRSKSKRKK